MGCAKGMLGAALITVRASWDVLDQHSSTGKTSHFNGHIGPWAAHGLIGIKSSDPQG